MMIVEMINTYTLFVNIDATMSSVVPSTVAETF